jgi:hypothetical protein
MRPDRWPLLVLVALAPLAACCARDPRSGGAARGVHGSDEPVVVTGTVRDAATGEPVAGARVQGPHDVKATTDDQGRFTLKGLHVGDEGEVVVTTSDRRQGSVTLRKLRGGTLEVVVHLRPIPRDRR